MRRNRFTPAAVFVAAGILTMGLPAPAQAALIYAEDFSGDAGTDLNGTTPATGSSPWIAAGAFKTDGSFIGVNQSAYLPFAPDAGDIYTLTGTFHFDPVNGTKSMGLQIGFAENAVTGNTRFTDAGPGARLWAQARNAANGNPDTSYLGPAAGGAQDAGTSSAGLIRIVLDTTGVTTWTAHWYFNTSLERTESFAALAPGTINYVGIAVTGFPAGGSGIGDTRFTSLELDAVPEPSAALLLLGALACCTGGGRRRATRRRDQRMEAAAKGSVALAGVSAGPDVPNSA